MNNRIRKDKQVFDNIIHNTALAHHLVSVRISQRWYSSVLSCRSAGSINVHFFSSIISLIGNWNPIIVVFITIAEVIGPTAMFTIVEKWLFQRFQKNLSISSIYSSRCFNLIRSWCIRFSCNHSWYVLLPFSNVNLVTLM